MRVRLAFALAALVGIASSPLASPPLPRPFAGIDMSALELAVSAGCEEGTEGCEVVTPLVTMELPRDVFDASSGGSPPRASDPAVAAASDAFFVWLTHPPDSFWVNLSPTEAERVIETNLGRTDVGKTLLEADLALKRTAASLLHPDHPLGARFWEQLYDFVGARGAKLCHSFRQWIVPGVASLQMTRANANANANANENANANANANAEANAKTAPPRAAPSPPVAEPPSCDASSAERSSPLPSLGSCPPPRPPRLLHVLRAPLTVKQESDVASGGGGLAGVALDADGAVRELCAGADPAARERAGELFERVILPELERLVNESPEYEALRAVFAWRVAAELYRSGGVPNEDEDEDEDEDEEVEGEGGFARRVGRRGGSGTEGGGSDGVSERARRRVASESAKLDAARWRRRADDGWTPASVFERYAASATEGEFRVTRDVETRDGDILRRTYFHGGVDFTRVRARVDLGEGGGRCVELGGRAGGGDERAPGAAALVAAREERRGRRGFTSSSA